MHFLSNKEGHVAESSESMKPPPTNTSNGNLNVLVEMIDEISMTSLNQDHIVCTS